MIQFLDDENLTDNERNDIDRILYHPKEVTKCEFPEELGYSFADENVKIVTCNSVGNSIDTSPLPLSFEHQHHQNNNHDNGNASAEQQQHHHHHHQQQQQQQMSNLNMNPSTISLAAAYGNQPGGIQNFIAMSAVPMTSQNFPAGQQPILSQAGTTYYQQQANYTTAALRAATGNVYMPYIFPANFNFSTGRFMLPPQGHMPPQHYPAAAVFYSPLMQQQQPSPQDSAPQQQQQTQTSADDAQNAEDATTATSTTATYIITDGGKEIDSCAAVNANDNNSQLQMLRGDDRRSTRVDDNVDNADIVNSSDFVNINNDTDNSNCTNNDNAPPDVPIVDEVLPTSATTTSLLSRDDIAHPNQLIFESSSASTNCQPTDNATTTTADNDAAAVVVEPSNNEDAAKLSIEQTGGVNENDEVSSRQATTTGVVDAGNNENVEKLSQPPEGVSANVVASAADDDKATAAPAAAAAKSWASLFKNSPAANNAIVINKFGDEKMINDFVASGDSPIIAGAHSSTGYSNSGENNNVAITTVERDPPAQKLGKELKLYRLQHRGPVFQLRGLNNYGNWCYVNATLQALMACPPFVHLLRKMTFMDRRTPSSTPMLDAFVKFVGEFPDRYTRKSSSQELDKGTSFEPKYIYTVLSSLKEDTSFKGRQEDAEEFLTLVLNHLHEEMAACLNYASDNNVQNGDALPIRSAAGVLSEDEWQQVLPGKKSAVTTRSAKLSPSPIVDIFSGVLRNAFQQHGTKESASSESFFTLQLSIQSQDIASVSSALMHMGKEVMKNVTTPSKNTKVEVDITRRTTFQELPIVLILHLKHFIFTDDVVKKLIKPFAYGMDLQIDRNLAPPVAPSVKFEKLNRSYKLFAVVFHHGEQAAGGHYTADIFHGGHWVNMDDSKVEIVDENHVTSFQPPRVPYLLFYRRCDTFSEIPRQSGGREFPPMWSSPPRGN